MSGESQMSHGREGVAERVRPLENRLEFSRNKGMKRAGTRREAAGGLRKEAVNIIRGAEAVIITRMKQARRLPR